MSIPIHSLESASYEGPADPICRAGAGHTSRLNTPCRGPHRICGNRIEAAIVPFGRNI